MPHGSAAKRFRPEEVHHLRGLRLGLRKSPGQAIFANILPRSARYRQDRGLVAMLPTIIIVVALLAFLAWLILRWRR